MHDFLRLLEEIHESAAILLSNSNGLVVSVKPNITPYMFKQLGSINNLKL